MVHNLKSWPGTFDAVASGVKTHEIRKADRDFKVGDLVVLSEWNLAVYEAEVSARMAAGGIHDEQLAIIKEEAKTKAFSGRSLMRRITYVSVPGSWGLPNDICVLSIGPAL